MIKLCSGAIAISIVSNWEEKKMEKTPNLEF